jgi:hypothetical protein
MTKERQETKRIMDIALSYTPQLDNKYALDSTFRKILLHHHQILRRCQILHHQSLDRILDRTPGLDLLISPCLCGVCCTLHISLIISIVVVVAVNVIDNLATDQTTDQSTTKAKRKGHPHATKPAGFGRLLLLLVVLLLLRITLRRIALRRVTLGRIALRRISLLVVGLLLRIALVS